MSTVAAPQFTAVQTTIASVATSGKRSKGFADRKRAARPCLIVSSIAEHRDSLEAAAARNGWDAEVFSDSVSALKQMCRTNYKMIVIDLEGAEDAVASYRGLAEHVQWIGSTLLVVNSRPDDQSAELWARQLGVWSYLPGLEPESNLNQLYVQAAETSDKLHAPRR